MVHLRKTVWLVIAAGLVSGGMVSAGALYFLGDRSRSLLLPEDADVVVSGKQIYAENCAVCHGVQLEGEPGWQTRKTDSLMPAPPHDATGHTWHHSSKLLFDMTKLGVAQAAGLKDYRSAMPAYENILTDAEIIAVLSFIKSTWPKEIRARHDELDAAIKAQSN